MLFQAARRKLSLMIVFALLVSTLTPHMVFGEAAQFKDITGSYAQKEIHSLTEAGIISGYEDNSFKPKKAMSRAELAKIIVLSLGLEANADQAAPFKDVAANSWYRGYVGALVKAGITEGTSATTFSPNANVTREELVVFFIRAFGWMKQRRSSRLIASCQISQRCPNGQKRKYPLPLKMVSSTGSKAVTAP